MKRTFFPLLAAAALLVTAFSGAADAEIRTRNLQLGHALSNNPNDNYHMLSVAFSESLKKLSGGKIAVEVFASAQLGNEREMIEGEKIGTIEMAVIGNASLAPFVKQCMVVDLPFMFPNSPAAHKVLDGPAGQKLFAAMEKNGIKPLAWGEGGFRHLINRLRPVKTPGDIAGMKLRAVENPLFIDTYKALDSNPTPMAWPETFTGLQQKTIDGLDIPITVIYTNKFNEIADYLSLTAHFYNALVITMSNQVWKSFNAEEQKIILQAAQEASATQRKFVMENEQKFVDDMAGKGLNVNKDIDFPAFQSKMGVVYTKYGKEIGQDMVDMFIKAVNDSK
ncbi:putative extracellular solute-binding protein [uncultured delta proteobacterium]|uniref:Putative extracellular solute-binding protein n=1 Tax=uncultured delta proteobacterium TaxID=34034 RepID=A0A212JCT8_9DELT|nr:putative extracellular solute-binding protein [uncultured delta proteobacterium]